MKKWLKKTMAVALTAAMVMSAGMPVFAAEDAIAGIDLATVTDEMLLELPADEYMTFMQNVDAQYGMEGLIVFNGTVVDKLAADLTVDSLISTLCDSQYSDGYKKYLLDVRSLYERQNNNNNHTAAFEAMMRTVLTDATVSDDLKQYIYQTIRNYTKEDIPMLTAELATATDEYLAGTALLKLTEVDEALAVAYIDTNLDLTSGNDEIVNTCMMNSLELLMGEGNTDAEEIFNREVTEYFAAANMNTRASMHDYSNSILLTANASQNEAAWVTVANHVDAFTDDILLNSVLSENTEVVQAMCSDTQEEAVAEAGEILAEKNVEMQNGKVKATPSYRGFAAFRDGVIVVEWHAGVTTQPTQFVHITRGGHPAIVDLNGFRENERFMGYYRHPSYAAGATKYDQIYQTAIAISMYPSISYTALVPLDATASSGKILPSAINKLRCDGLLEYSYEYNGVPVCSVYYNGATHWDISTVEGALAHNSLVNAITPKIQSSHFIYYAGSDV